MLLINNYLNVASFYIGLNQVTKTKVNKYFYVKIVLYLNRIK